MLDSILNVIIWRGRLFHQKQNLIILTSMAEEIVWCYLSFLILWKIKTQKAQCHQYFQKLLSLLGHSMSRLATGLVYLAKISPEKQSLDQSNAGIPKKLYSIGRNYIALIMQNIISMVGLRFLLMRTYLLQTNQLPTTTENYGKPKLLILVIPGMVLIV